MPVTMPAVTVASALDVLHVPPATLSVSVMLEPRHTFVGPPIAAGSGLTVIVALLPRLVAAHVLESVKAVTGS